MSAFYRFKNLRNANTTVSPSNDFRCCFPMKDAQCSTKVHSFLFSHDVHIRVVDSHSAPC